MLHLKRKWSLFYILYFPYLLWPAFCFISYLNLELLRIIVIFCSCLISHYQCYRFTYVSLVIVIIYSTHVPLDITLAIICLIHHFWVLSYHILCYGPSQHIKYLYYSSDDWKGIGRCGANLHSEKDASALYLRDSLAMWSRMNYCHLESSTEKLNVD